MRTRKHIIRSVALAATALGLIPGAALASTPKSAVVLGKSVAHSQGWGTAAPSVISGGSNTPISQIHWQHWGSATATGWGLTKLQKQTGGYYAGLYRVSLRASSISYDSRDHAQAYMVLQAREPLAPGARLSPWFQWLAQREMCN
jgi:hypothetical protein